MAQTTRLASFGPFFRRGNGLETHRKCISSPSLVLLGTAVVVLVVMVAVHVYH